MICLACDADNSYTLQQCSRCGVSFSKPPPFLHPNHVSQLTTSIQAFADGRLDRADLFRRLDAFVRIYSVIDQEWDFSQPLTPRLNSQLVEAGTPRQHLTQGVQRLDEGFELLGTAVAGLEQLRDGDGPATVDELPVLEQSAAELISFFHAACQGSATLMNALEPTQASSERLGSLIDIQSS